MEKVTHANTNQSKSHISSVQFSCSVVSDSLQPHESQRARPPCPSPTSRVHSYTYVNFLSTSKKLINKSTSNQKAC